MSWKVKHEQIEDFENQENHLFWIDALIAQTIPIYTIKKPNPKSGKEDCPITVREKEHFRTVMKVKLGAAITGEDKQNIIDHYTNLFNER
jgi:hypothetical protein